ncbi:MULTISPECIES: hypothetical protein [unclassified Haloferax]|uniref:hypothetical protein n=1 Tax=unclassified Haloferax TaxID=2625095 RepID=UPI0028745FFD|nr:MULTISPECIES: hypothetical protein [unclassified Haloferax]MDS0243743.1 hypothetical protein [Haloferax sp. S2CR25]MDS0446864.1 hypothetical protein [Haloferax sp. S2CR25-2]
MTETYGFEILNTYPPAVKSSMSHILKYGSHTLLTAGLIIVTMSTTVAAQEGVGSGICGTPLAETINQAAPLVVGTLMIGAAILSYILHTAAAFPKDPQSVQTFKNWRNRAGMSAVTTPLFAVVIEMFIGFTGTSTAECVSIVPFF